MNKKKSQLISEGDQCHIRVSELVALVMFTKMTQTSCCAGGDATFKGSKYWS